MMFLDYEGSYPDDLLETVTIILTDNLKNMDRLNTFICTPSTDLIKYHFGLGMDLRNHYKLWNNKTIKKYIGNTFPTPHPDDISFIWMEYAHQQLLDKYELKSN